MECVVLEFPEPESGLEQLGKVTHSGINLTLCIGNLSFVKPLPRKVTSSSLKSHKRQ